MPAQFTPHQERRVSAAPVEDWGRRMVYPGSSPVDRKRLYQILLRISNPSTSLLFAFYCSPFVWYKYSIFVPQCGKSIRIHFNPMPMGHPSILLFFSFFSIRAPTTNHLFLLHPRVFGQRSGRKDDVVRNGLQRGSKPVQVQNKHHYPSSDPTPQRSV